MQLSEPKFVDTSRGRFAYREAGSGKTLVLLHGWPESSYCWAGVTGELKGDYRVIAPDLRGLGDSTREGALEDFQKQRLATDVVELLDALGVEDFYLAGHDWGGVVAQEVALAVESRVKALILMNIAVINNLRGNMEVIQQVRQSGSPFYWYQHFQQTENLPEAMIPGNEEVWLRYFLRTWSKEGFPDDALREYVRFYSIPATPGTGANYYRTFAMDAKRWATLGEHKWPMPGLFIYGNKDVVIIPGYLKYIEDCFDSIRVEQIEAGHFVQEEQPALVAGYMEEFLAGLE